MYFYEAKNKFPHLVLIPHTEDYIADDTANSRYVEWLRTNLGKYGVEWSTTNASFYKGQKFYWSNNSLSSDERWKVRGAKQFGFKTKENAMRFKLLCL